MREIVLDTETTGLDPKEGHCLTEIGALELFNYIPTGKTYKQYINPERDISIESINITGLTADFLKDFPTFSEIVTDFLDFIGDSPLIIHNASFDMAFINHQLINCGFPALENKIIDTLLIAREKFPGSPASLDALCRRFQIDNSNRELHGALLDSELLAEVYLELKGGRQRGLGLIDAHEQHDNQSQGKGEQLPTASSCDFPYRNFNVSQEERDAHTKMLTLLTDPLWKNKA